MLNDSTPNRDYLIDMLYLNIFGNIRVYKFSLEIFKRYLCALPQINSFLNYKNTENTS